MKTKLAFLTAILFACIISINVINKINCIDNIFDEIGMSGRSFVGIPYTKASVNGSEIEIVQPDTLKYYNAYQRYTYTGNKLWTVQCETHENIVYFIVYSDAFTRYRIRIDFKYDIQNKILEEKLGFYARDDTLNYFGVSLDEATRELKKYNLSIDQAKELVEDAFNEFLNYWVTSNGINSKFSNENYGKYDVAPIHFRYYDVAKEEHMEVELSKIMIHSVD